MFIVGGGLSKQKLFGGSLLTSGGGIGGTRLDTRLSPWWKEALELPLTTELSDMLRERDVERGCKRIN